MKFHKLYKLIMEEKDKVLKLNDGDVMPVNYTGVIEYPGGTRHWYLNGELHREDGPAKITRNDIQIWYNYGRIHREDGPAIKYPDGGEEWCINGKRHRKDGPALKYPDGESWWLNGVLHREDGPAVEYANGDKCWYLNGKKYSEQNYKRELIRQGILKDPSLSDVMDAI